MAEHDETNGERAARLRRLPLNGLLAGGLAAALSVSTLGLSPITAGAADAATNPDWSVPLGTMYSVVDQVDARALWERGVTGAGVNVAVIDTGVAPVDALGGSGKVVALVDLSAEAAVPEARFVDTYGHGTHMAGIIAGRDPGADPLKARAHPEWFLGVAPDAGIVSVKVGDNTGAVDISQVIAGVDWVVDHAEEFQIRVINLSYSSGSTLSAKTDPLSFAVERAWKAGIVVVVAAGNDGKDSARLASPADNPYVIAVAAAETQSWPQMARRGPRYRVPKWATSGTTARPPDVSAPGAHIESLRAPFSRVDLEHSEGYVSTTLFLGSGSSQAAAIVSGSVALLLQDRPELKPDQVKALLKTSAARVTPASKRYSGAGVIQVGAVAQTAATNKSQTWVPATGTGSIEAARGGQTAVIDGTILTGDVTVLGTPWDGTRWSGTRWSNGTWDGTRWSGGEWMGTRWSDASWTAGVWLGTRWSGTRWSSSDWTDASWSAASWTGTRWSGTRWSGSDWSGSTWSDQAWTGTRWSGAGWR